MKKDKEEFIEELANCGAESWLSQLTDEEINYFVNYCIATGVYYFNPSEAMDALRGYVTGLNKQKRQFNAKSASERVCDVLKEYKVLEDPTIVLLIDNIRRALEKQNSADKGRLK